MLELGAWNFLFVLMHFPAKIIPERFRQDRRRVRLRHYDVMLEALFADVVHEFLQARNFRDSAVTERVERIVCEFAFTDVSSDFTIGIGSRDATKRQWPGGRATIQRAISILDTDDAAENRRGGDFDVRQKGFRPVAAME